MSSNNTIVTEKINFTPTGEINRTLPILLADNGKMSLQVWNQFCDRIDDIVGHSRVSCINAVNWVVVVILIVLLSTGWLWINGNWFWYPILGVALGVGCFTFVPILVGSIHKKNASKITQACASASNHDKNLTMKLVGTSPHDWYIEVGVRNPVDVEQGAAIPVAEAVPAGAFPAASSPAKYVKDQTGKMSLNPEYKKWMESNKA